MCIINAVLKSPYLRTSNHFSREYVMAVCWYNPFLSLQSLSELPIICITSQFNTYSIIKLFSFSTVFGAWVSGLREDFVFNSMILTAKILLFFIPTKLNISLKFHSTHSCFQFLLKLKYIDRVTVH